MDEGDKGVEWEGHGTRVDEWGRMRAWVRGQAHIICATTSPQLQPSLTITTTTTVQPQPTHPQPHLQ